jgi:hypothetical protein
MASFWDIALICLHHQGDEALIVLMVEAVRTSKTSVHLNETTLLCIPEGSHLQLATVRTLHNPRLSLCLPICLSFCLYILRIIIIIAIIIIIFLFFLAAQYPFRI